MSPWYDTEEGVRAHLVSLEVFNELVRERRMAYYHRHEELHDFRVLNGKYQLDSCGNALKNIGGCSFAFQSDIPPAGLKCSHCRQEWSINNVDDTVVRRSSESVSLDSYIGQTLGDVIASFKKANDAVYLVAFDLAIRNDKYIDLSPAYPEPKNDFEKTRVKNKDGWLRRSDCIKDSYVIQKGDETFVDKFSYFHRACNRIDLDATYARKFSDLFADAGFRDINIKSTLNQYCDCDHCAPWYNVSTEHGTFLIGWRKRVINIDWSGVNKEGLVVRLFDKEDVTMGETYIHAWGWDKAREYLKAIRAAF